MLTEWWTNSKTSSLSVPLSCCPYMQVAAYSIRYRGCYDGGCWIRGALPRFNVLNEAIKWRRKATVRTGANFTWDPDTVGDVSTNEPSTLQIQEWESWRLKTGAASSPSKCRSIRTVQEVTQQGSVGCRARDLSCINPSVHCSVLEKYIPRQGPYTQLTIRGSRELLFKLTEGRKSQLYSKSN